MPSRIEAVTTCVNYSDYLRHTIPFTLREIDHLTVVTTPDDKATAEVCRNAKGERAKVKIVTTDKFSQGGGRFNKGAALNVGFNAMKREGWVLHLDADVILPYWFGPSLDKINLNPEVMYGAMRCNICSWHFYKTWLTGGCHPLKGILSGDSKENGRSVMGFFQLFHPSASALRGQPPSQWYSEKYRYANTSDTDFSKKWKRQEVLPLAVVHLGPNDCTNWGGRKSPKFG